MANISRIIRLPVVIERMGASRSSIYACMQKFEFPKNLRLGKRASGWLGLRHNNNNREILMEHKEKARVLSAGGRSQIRTVTFPDPSLGLPAVQLSSGAMVSSSTIAAESCDPEHLPRLVPLCLWYNSGRLAYTLPSLYPNSNTKFVYTSRHPAMHDCVLLFADEAFWAGDKQGENVLKALITEPTLAIEPKGKDLLTVKNCLHIMMASNNEWVVPAGSSNFQYCAIHLDDRRP
jgi:Family of unknown function (DUF5906)/Prophage CP4-57 regulatory protein (AlpA)